MPTYAYACTQCDHRFDALQAFTDDALTDCPRCGSRLRKLFGNVGVVFKGSGFYRTDARNERKGKIATSAKVDTASAGSGDGSGSGSGASSTSASGGSGGPSTSGSSSSSGGSGGSGSSSTSGTSGSSTSGSSTSGSSSSRSTSAAGS